MAQGGKLNANESKKSPVVASFRTVGMSDQISDRLQPSSDVTLQAGLLAASSPGMLQLHDLSLTQF
jgi:hypothetical protein